MDTRRGGPSQRAVILWFAIVEAAILLPLLFYLGCQK